MKYNHFKAYFLLPQLVKEAQQKLSQFTAHSADTQPTSKQVILKHQPRPKIEQSEICFENISSQSESIFGLGGIERQNNNVAKLAVSDLIDENKHNENKQNCSKNVNLTIPKNQNRLNTKNQVINKVLRDIKTNKQIKRTRKISEIKQETKEDSFETQKISEQDKMSIDNTIKQQTMSTFVEQMLNSQNVLFDPLRFQTFLKDIHSNQQFQRSLRAFIWSYFIEHEQSK